MNLLVCSVCGHVVFGTAPEFCPVCHAPKEKLEQNNSVFTDSAAKSPEASVKHVPVVQVVKECKLVEPGCIDVIIKVGEVKHPMEEKHFIQFVDTYVDDLFVSRTSFTPAVNAATAVHLKVSGKKVRVVERCNIHGWWQAEADL